MACHMPRRDAKDGGHTAFTDHRIQRRPDTPVDLPSDSEIAAWREPSPELQERNLGIAYIDVGMQRHSAPFVIRGYRALTEVQNQFANDSVLFKWIGEALLLGKQTADAKLAFERALELDPDSALAEASAASPYIQEGDDRPANRSPAARDRPRSVVLADRRHLDWPVQKGRPNRGRLRVVESDSDGHDRARRPFVIRGQRFAGHDVRGGIQEYSGAKRNSGGPIDSRNAVHVLFPWRRVRLLSRRRPLREGRQESQANRP